MKDIIAELAEHGWSASLEKAKRLADADMTWLRVREKKPVERPEYVYGLEVKPRGREYENFIGGLQPLYLHNTQNVKDISPRALSNLSGMVIVLRMEDEGDIRRVCENFGIPEHLRSGIHYFDVWHGIVKLNYKRGARVFRGVIRPELKPETVRVRIPDPEMDDFPAMERYMRDVTKLQREVKRSE